MAKSNLDLWSVGQRSETGYVRSENQDRMSWIRAPAGDVFVVSDGMGGHAGGALAAELTVGTLQERLSGMTSLENASDTLKSAFLAANETVYLRGQTGNSATARMGATAVALLAAGGRIMLAHVGDSRAYLFSRRGVLRRLTKDHSLVQRMVDAGVLTEAQAASHPDSSVLERAMGQSPQVEVEVSEWLTLGAGDVCMLCSDGLCGYADDDEIAAVMRNGLGPQDIADSLVKLALDRGGEDNVTVQVLRYGGGSMLRRWFSRGALSRIAVGVPVALAALGLGWFGMHPKQFVAGGGSENASESVAASAAVPTSKASTAVSGIAGVPAASVPLAAASAPPAANRPVPATAVATRAPASIEARVATLERDAAERRARDDQLMKQLDSLSARIEQLDRKANIASPASTPATARARKSTQAKIVKKPAQQAPSAGAPNVPASAPSAAAAAPSAPAASSAPSPAPATASPRNTPSSEPAESGP